MSEDKTLSQQLAETIEAVANLNTVIDTERQRMNGIVEEIDGKFDNLEQLQTDVHTVINKTYPQLDTRLVQVSLEQSYNDIIEAYPELDGVSAVGLKAILNHGDTIYRNGNRLFYLDGTTYTELTADSLTSAAAEGDTEVAIVWYFANNNTFSLPTTADYMILECFIKGGTPQILNADIPRDYVENTNVLYFKDFTGLTNTNLKEKKIINLQSSFGVKPVNAKEVVFKNPVCNFTGQDDFLYNNSKCKKVSFVNVETVTFTTTNGHTPFYTGPTYKIIVDYIGLKEIKDSYNANVYNSGFSGNWQVTLPSTVVKVGLGVFAGSAVTGNQYPSVILNCPNATFHNQWFGTGYADSLTLANEWNATINLAVATNNPTIYTLDWFTNLIDNKLKDNTGENTAKAITVPASIATALASTQHPDSELNYIEWAEQVKNWTIS